MNTAVNKLRAALGDPADSPRFVETVPRAPNGKADYWATRELAMNSLGD